MRENETALELEVSKYIGRMPLLWLNVNDPPGRDSSRALVEKNSIALLSNYDRDPLDTASRSWLGKHSDRSRVRESDLWNSDYVDSDYDPAFLKTLKDLIVKM